MKNKRPCIKGLKDFQKRGCPEKYWDKLTGEGCPAWKEYTVPAEQPDKPPRVIKDCVEMLSEYWHFEALKLLEGNQKATESFRNGMCEAGPDGQIYPKVDRGVLGLMSMLQRQKEDMELLDNNN